MSEYWKASKYSRSKLENKYSKWLSWAVFNPDDLMTDDQPSTSKMCRKILDAKKNKPTGAAPTTAVTSGETSKVEMETTTMIEASTATLETTTLMETKRKTGRPTKATVETTKSTKRKRGRPTKSMVEAATATGTETETAIPERAILQTATLETTTTTQSTKKRGRPTKLFHESSRWVKNRRISELIEKYSLQELEYAVQKLKKTTSHQSIKKSFLPSEALALYIDLDLSERKYNTLRHTINSLHPNCLPSLYALQSEKQKIVPYFTATETSAAVNLKSIMRRTAEGLIEICDEPDDLSKLSVICKWGMDGSSGHSRYKQKFSDDTQTDEFMFFIAFVPLKMINMTTQKEIWTNKVASSTHYCRPIKFLLAKENAVLVMEEYNLINTAIENIETVIIEKNGKVIEIVFDMHCTMIDGSVANILTNTNSASRCFICKSSPTEMNNMDFVREPDVNSFKFGLSTLHSWIRFLECVLHIAYRLSFKKWRVSDETREEFLETKKRIQHEFKVKMGLMIDQVKSGFGTTNDGNTARRFFANSSLTAEITGVNKQLIENFAIILRVLSCGLPINTHTFEELLTSTKNIYLTHYDWYYMPSSVHKVLIHGCEVIQFFEIPIGCLSEEALEANHKHIRKARLAHTRKISRESTNKDLMTHLLLASDPVLSSKRKLSKNKTKAITYGEEIQKYILNDNFNSDEPSFSSSYKYTSEESSTDD